MQVVITGATGFLGSHVAEAFVQRGDHVRALVRPTSQTRFLESLGVELSRASLDQVDRLREAMRGADLVVHGAAKVEPYGPWREFHETTVQGTASMLQAATEAGVGHFVQISSVGVYGNPRRDGRPFDETCPYGRPARWNYYSRAKIAAEQLVRRAQQAGTLDTTILRPDWMYGPRDVATFGRMAAALRARRFKWIGDGANKLSLIYVTDVARAVTAVAASPAARGQVFNVIAGEASVSQRQFISRICQLLELPLPATSLPYGLARLAGLAGECVAHGTGFRVCPPLSRLTVLLVGGHRRYSSAKLQNDLGWRAAVSWEEGTQKTADWYRRESP